jgi:hypothetical protein
MATEQVDSAVGAHLVGGLKAPDAETAMSTAGAILGRHLYAVTDGETGERDQWIGWQLGKLTSIERIDWSARRRRQPGTTLRRANSSGGCTSATGTHNGAAAVRVHDRVNIAVLVLRRERAEHEHFTAPSVFPILGAIVSVALILDTALDDLSTAGRRTGGAG